MVFVSIIETIFDHTQPSRPWSEVFVRPRLPIRENWRFRLFVNLIWFARNYLNFIFLAVMLSMWWFPGFLLPVLCTIYIHTARQAPLRRALSQVAQLGSMTLNTYLYGFAPGFIFTMALVLVICAHAVLTVYSDEAVERYHQVIQSSGVAAELMQKDIAPRTPVTSYVPKAFAEEPLPPLPSSSTNRPPLRRLAILKKSQSMSTSHESEAFSPNVNPAAAETTEFSSSRGTPHYAVVGVSRSFNVLPNTKPIVL